MSNEPYSNWLGSAEHPDLIWWNLLDKRYLVEVHRTGDYEATFHLFDGDEPLVRPIEVGLAFGAVFGPDESDVLTWQEMAIQIIEERQ